MLDVPFRVQREPFFTAVQLENIEEAAIRLLTDVGVKIPDDDLRGRASRAGFAISGDRARFERGKVAGFIDGERERNGRSFSQASAPSTDEPITLGVSQYSQNHIDLDTGAVRPITYEALVEATKLVTSMGDKGLGGYVPGVPRDVPSQLQAILEYRIGAEFGPRVTLDTLNPPQALPYLFEMAEAMGNPMEGGGMFTVSPLRLSGYEFDVAVRHADRWKNYGVTTYPMVGATAPVRLRSAWVMSIAEAIGGAITLHLVGGGKPVYMNIGMFPFDLRTFAAAGGLPECAWMYWSSAQVTRFYDPRAGYSMMMGTQAKLPGVQAGYEKAMAGTLGVLTGCDDLHYVGVMSFDDVFSPIQMVLDCELRDMLKQLRAGVPPQDPGEWLDDIREGVERGFVAADTTLDHYRETYWFPRLFDRTNWHTFASGQGRTACDRARADLQERLDSYDFRPPAHIAALRTVFERAWRELGGDPSASYLPLLFNE